MEFQDKIRVSVKTGCDKQSLTYADGWFVAQLKENPSKNKANKELLRFLKDEYGERYIIKHGQNSSKKLLVKY